MRLINNRSIVQLRVSTNEVIEAGLSLFQHIYGDKTKALETLRFLSYSRMQMIAKKLNPSRLPPSTSSATKHILRSYLQYHNWVTLDTASLNPLHYGWEFRIWKLLTRQCFNSTTILLNFQIISKFSNFGKFFRG